MDLGGNSVIENDSTIEEPLLTVNDQSRDSNDRSEDLVDGLTYKTSLLIKSLYFLDALYVLSLVFQMVST